MKEGLVAGAIIAALFGAVHLTLGSEGGVPACEYEDGSTQTTCIWDADGSGASYQVWDGGTENAVFEYITDAEVASRMGE